jgi:hypothetical protein
MMEKVKMSDRRLRQMVYQALKDNGATVEKIVEKVRNLGWRFSGVAQFAVLQVLNELIEELVVKRSGGKYEIIPGRIKPQRPPKKTGSDLRAIVLGKRFFPDDEEKRTELTGAVGELIDQIRKENNKTIIVEPVDDQFKASVCNTKMEATGTTITEAIGILSVLFADQLGFDFQAKG